MDRANAKKRLEEMYVGKTVIVTIYDPYHPYIAREGVVEDVDDALQLHGTWGGLAAIPGVDKIEIKEDA